MATTPIGNLDGSSLRAASTSTITKDNPLPGMTRPKATIIDPAKQRVRFQKFNMSDPLDMSELERIQTKAWRGEGVYLIEEKNYVFMDIMYYLIKYIEDAE